MLEVLEGLAAAVLGETGCGEGPTSAYELAWCCGLSVYETATPGAIRVGQKILVDGRARPVRRHGLIAHEVGHWALEWGGLPDSEEDARFLAGALMLPREPFSGALDETWQIPRLRPLYPNVSAEMMAHRISQLRPCRVTIFDDGRITKRWASPWLPPPCPIDPAWRELYPHCLAANGGCIGRDRAYAFALFDPPHHRVVALVSEEN